MPRSKPRSIDIGWAGTKLGPSSDGHSRSVRQLCSHRVTRRSETRAERRLSLSRTCMYVLYEACRPRCMGRSPLVTSQRVHLHGRPTDLRSGLRCMVQATFQPLPLVNIFHGREQADCAMPG
jgi:hypothetical protein